MKKIGCLILLLSICVPLKAYSTDINMEVLVDNRIEDMSIPSHLRDCVKRETMDELRRRGSIQTFILDLVIRKIIISSEKYCRSM